MKGNSFLIAAGGHGTRLGGLPKQFRELGGKPLWSWSLDLCRRLYDEDLINECIVILPTYAIAKGVGDLFATNSLPVTFVEGGRSRRESVLSGLNKCSGQFVLIHDAARPFLSVEVCRRLIESSTCGEGVIPCMRITDALKYLGESTTPCPVARENYMLTQTPQCFPTAQIKQLLESADDKIKDEAEVWIGSGRKLKTVEGDPMNFKITYERDWNMAEYVLGLHNEIRTGYGFDVHPMVPGRKIILAGVEIADFPLGLHGHSDADVVCHASADAVLGAAGMPDIGTLFPASDAKYKDADSLVMLTEVFEKVISQGWDIRWIDVVIHAQKPILAGYICSMTNNIESLFYHKSPMVPSHVNIKVKSGEGIGPVGDSECIECYAVATLVRYNSAF